MNNIICIIYCCLFISIHIYIEREKLPVANCIFLQQVSQGESHARKQVHDQAAQLVVRDRARAVCIVLLESVLDLFLLLGRIATRAE